MGRFLIIVICAIFTTQLCTCSEQLSQLAELIIPNTAIGSQTLQEDELLDPEVESRIFIPGDTLIHRLLPRLNTAVQTTEDAFDYLKNQILKYIFVAIWLPITLPILIVRPIFNLVMSTMRAMKILAW